MNKIKRTSLEEAAEDLFETIEIQEHENIFEDTFKKIFIAGAEWMRKKMEAGRGYDSRDLYEAYEQGRFEQKEQMMKKGVEKHCHTVEEWIEHIKNADALTKAIFSEGPYNVLYDALNRPYRDCYDAIKEFGELCYQTARQDMMKDAVEAEITVGRLPDDWSLAYNPDELHRALLKFKSGDKVKIIIVKQ